MRGQKPGQNNGDGQLPSREPTIESLVREYWPVVFRMLARLTGKSHDAEDLAQETFLRAMKNLHTFTPGSNMRAWLLRIASNAFLDLKRKQTCVGMHSITVESMGTSMSAAQAMEITEQSELAKAFLDELPEQTRLIFHLRVQEELSFREIGEIVGMNENAARQQMHQARLKLLKRFEH